MPSYHPAKTIPSKKGTVVEETVAQQRSESSQKIKEKGNKKPLFLSTARILRKSSPVSPAPTIGSSDRNANVK